MAVPTEYTEVTLAQYMYGIVTTAIADSGWTVGVDDAGSLTEPVNDVLIGMGLSDAMQIEPDRIEETRLRARVAVWLAVVEEKVPLYDAGGLARTLSRSQIFQQAYMMLQRAETALTSYVNAELAEARGGIIPESSVAYVLPVWVVDYDD